jgi:hypothetical protein
VDSYLQRLAMIESSGNPLAKNPNSSAKGLYQFMPRTAQQYGITAPFGTPEYTSQEQDAVKRLTEDNRNALRKFLNREPTEGELYLAHQQGATGAKRLLTNPQAPAVNVVGEDAVTLNAGNPNMTAEEFAQLWTSKFEQPQLTNTVTTTNTSQDLSMAMQEPTTFNIELPDGTVLEGIPQGTTKEQIKQKLQSSGYDVSLLDKEPQQPVIQEPQQGFLNRVASDLSKRGGQISDAFSRYSPTQGYTKENQGIGSTALQTGGAIAGGLTDILGNTAISAFRALPDAVKQPIRETTANIGASIGDSALGRLVSTAGQEYSNWSKENPIESANIGALANIANVAPVLKPLGGTLQSAKSGVGRATSKILPSIDDSVIPLAQRAKDFGIDLRLDQIAPSRFRDTLQKTSQSIPLSGTEKFEALQSTKWNKALAGTMGIDDLQPKNIQAFKANNSKMFDDVLSQRNIQVSPDDVASIDNYRSLMDDLHGLTAEDKRIVSKKIDNIIDTIGVGENKGQKFASLRNDLLEKANNAGEASPPYYDLIDMIDEIAKKSLTPEDIAKLAEARKHYKYYKTIQKSLSGKPLGELSPTELMSKVASSKYIDASSSAIGEDDLIDLARIGKQFLAKKGGSDTATNIGIGGTLILGTGSLANPAVAVPALGVAGATMGVNRALQSGVLRNQSIINNMINKSPLFIKPSSQSLKNYGILGAGSTAYGLQQEE